MNNRFRRLTILCLCLLSVFGVLPFTGAIASASSTGKDPQVIVAIDTTAASHCSRTLIAHKETAHPTVTHPACSPGSDVTTYQVALSAAKARHLSYVILPSAQASASVWAQTSRQIQQLVRNVRAAAGASQRLPLSSCASGNYEDFDVWSPSFNTKLQLQAYTNYYLYSNCSVYIGQVGIGIFGSGYEYLIFWGYDYHNIYQNCAYIIHGNYGTQNENYNAPGGYSPEWSSTYASGCPSPATRDNHLQNYIP